MFYISQVCPVCSGGSVGFRRCSDGSTVLFVCDECNATWLLPDTITAQAALFPKSPNYTVSGMSCSISGLKSGWATLIEINNAKLESYIKGEGQALDD